MGEGTACGHSVVPWTSVVPENVCVLTQVVVTQYFPYAQSLSSVDDFLIFFMYIKFPLLPMI